MQQEPYISLEEAAQILRVSTRQVHNYIAADRLHTRKEGKRRLVLEADVHALADEIGSANKKEPPPPIEMLPDTGPMIDYIRELNSQAMMMSRRIGELEALLQMRLLPEDVEATKQQLAETEARAKLLEEEAERLREQLRIATQPWYKKLLT